MPTPIVLDNDYLKKFVPSVFATEPFEGTSKQYQFYPTITVIDALRKEGFQPVYAKQSNTRIPGKHLHTRHMLRFRHQDLFNTTIHVGDELPEIVLVNSHDGTTRYQLYAGLFRLVCANGMVVSSATLNSINIKHDAIAVDQVIEGSYKIIEETPAIFESVERYKNIELTQLMQISYAKVAAELLKPNLPLAPEALLKARRQEDTSNSLWVTMNRVQENFMRGGIPVRTAIDGRQVNTKPIRAVKEDMHINRTLWKLTDEMAKMVA